MELHFYSNFYKIILYCAFLFYKGKLLSFEETWLIIGVSSYYYKSLICLRISASFERILFHIGWRLKETEKAMELLLPLCSSRSSHSVHILNNKV